MASSSSCRAGRSREPPENPPSSKLSLHRHPALVRLALDVGPGRLALGIEGVELLLQPVVGRDPGVDRTAQPLALAGHDRTPEASRAVRRRHTEEAAAVPAGAGDGAGDLGQAAVGGAVPGEAVLERHDVADPASPLPHQDRAGPDGACVRDRQRDRLIAAGGIRSGDLLEVAPRGGIEITVGGRLQLVGEEPQQQMPGQVLGCRPAAQAVPARLQGLEVEISQLRDLDLGCRLLRVERHGLRPSRSGQHRRPTHRPAARSGRRSCRPRGCFSPTCSPCGAGR